MYNLFDYLADLDKVERVKLDITTLPVDNNIEKMLTHEYTWSYEDERDQVIKEIKERAKTKTYHYGNTEKNLYVYSIKNDDEFNLFFQNDEYTIRLDYRIKDLNEELRFPACAITWFNPDGSEATDYLRDLEYGNGKEFYQKDHRDKVILDDWGFRKIAKWTFEESVHNFCSFSFTIGDLNDL